MALPIVPFLIWTAPILLDVIWDILNSPEPTDNVKIVKEPPQPCDVPDLPDRPNTIKPPVKRIYDPPTVQDPQFPPPPPLPDRILPPVSTNTESSPISLVKQSLANKKYGCLFSKPYIAKELVWCQEESAQDFYTELYRQLEARVQTLEEETSALKVAVAMLSLNNISGIVPVIGVDMLNEIGKYYDRNCKVIDQLPTTGMVTTLGIRRIPCTTPTVTADYPNLLLELMNECAIPLEYYKDMEGYKGDQLQIIWRNQNWGQGNYYPKVTVLPSPRQATYYDEEMFRSVLPEWRYSGLTRVDIELQGKIPANRINEGIGFDEAIHGACERWRRDFNVFTGYLTKEQVEQFIETDYKEWVRQLCTEDVRYSKFVTNGYSSIEVHECWVYPYRAVLLGWDTTGKRWITKAHWYIHKKQPQTAPPSSPI